MREATAASPRNSNPVEAGSGSALSVGAACGTPNSVLEDSLNVRTDPETLASEFAESAAAGGEKATAGRLSADKTNAKTHRRAAVAMSVPTFQDRKR
jgi:hypothetical protein